MVHTKAIDIYKAIGIALVVVGHVYQNQLSEVIYLFHMPMFFILSGYLFNPNYGLSEYINKKSLSLLIPYITFLLIFTTTLSLKPILHADFAGLIQLWVNAVKGGTYLTGLMTVFWFVTCLLATQSIFAALQKYLNPTALTAVMGLLLLIQYWINFTASSTASWWLGLNALTLSLPLFYLGFICRQKHIFDSAVVGYCVALLWMGLSVHLFIAPQWYQLDMKFAQINSISLVMLYAVSASLSIMFICQKLVQATGIARLLCPLGAASLTIMYLHQPFHFLTKHYLQQNLMIVSLIALLCPLGLHYLFTKKSLLSRCFLGRRVTA
ncbi:acyltransferase family protein [Catenovulum sp. 2E275]|uniref:acyltransferase family protein n=1 Tax=Catenovulum sp. 2E275 TaxID=2980497 RepID=UPI0021D0316A|nr:acyltransferase family protein [Catenovulum sp. 2E275]MCU4674828.1 acyltransferase family protein [Catenovulum sp. 2E275]